MERVAKGTTTLGIIFKDGVVMASDRQSTAAYIESRFEKKLHKITDNLAITTAGVVGDLQYLVRLLRVEANLYEMGNGDLTVRSMATLLSNILHSNRWYPYIVGVLIGGYDKGPKLFSIDPLGGLGSGEQFFSTGSGSPIALGVLETSYIEGLTEQQAIELAEKAIGAAKERDIYTGGKKIDIAVIDKKGFRLVE
ncbi:MAG: proteasome subunit beta [Candidatus Altiarchaeota archaeon]|nr:proteasome subunit beta [Candidatus Altiarchaeota archaeon]